jgi:hypothetical protein
MTSYLTMGILGALEHTLVLHSMGSTEATGSNLMDVSAIGFGGGVLGGAIERWWGASSSSTWKASLFSLVGVLLYDYFLFEV